MSSTLLMRRAAAAVASFVQQQFPQARQVTVLCGRGNNGGDGMMAARLLVEAGLGVRALLLGTPEELRDDAALAWEELGGVAGCVRGVVQSESDLAEFSCALLADVLVDAVVGTGFTPPLRGLALAAREWMLASSAAVVAVDLPSGWAADGTDAEPAGPVFAADAVITFTAPKPAHVFGHLTRGWRQPVVVAPIGSLAESVLSTWGVSWAGGAVDKVQAPRQRAANKGSYGHVLVVGGSIGHSGAASMTGLAALRAGAGLVTVAVPAALAAMVAAVAPELMTAELAATRDGSIAAENLERIGELTARKTVLAVGPGMGQSAEAARFLMALLEETRMPAVVDADGLNLLALAEAAHRGTIARLADRRLLVLTPHPGEMSRLVGIPVSEIQTGRLNVARSFAERHGVTLVLKGARTVIASPDGAVAVNTSGNPGMAKGGSGDLLTGLIAGLLAQSAESAQWMETIAAAVWLHGLSADMAVRAGDEHTLLATDSLRYLSAAFRYRPCGQNGYVWLQGQRDGRPALQGEA